MKRSWMLVVSVLLWAPTSQAAESPLDALQFLVGEWNGEGTHPYGKYRETQTIQRALNGSVLEARTQSKMGERVVHQDLRVFSWDAANKTLRLRQWTAAGLLRVYSGTVNDDGSVVFTETAREGASDERWRYTFRPAAEGGFAYRVDVQRDGDWKPFVSGALSKNVPPPTGVGTHGRKQYDVRIAAEGKEWAAQIHHPDGKGPFPVLVFSPGGDAGSVQGYGHYGQWWATWGYVTVIVAFRDKTAAERAAKFAKVLDWIERENEREGSPLAGRIDTKRFAVAGHSRGGHAALRAARLDKRVRACLALAPSGPLEELEGHECPTCFIIGSADRFIPGAQSAYRNAPNPRTFVTIQGMSHMLGPRAAALELAARSTAFWNSALKGDARYASFLTAVRDGVKVERTSR